MPIDDVDERVHLSPDERCAKRVRSDDCPQTDVSPGTIRNRIQRLEEEGVIRGYHAHIDYSEIDGMLTALFQCDSSVSESETLAKRALDAPDVINVRELAPGRGKYPSAGSRS